MITISTSFLVRARENTINLNGYIIYIDAGHGGKDNGANYNDILEDSINLNIATLLVQDLLDVGATIVTSRDGDYDLASNYDKNRKNKDLKRRVELINLINPHLFISIHLNTYDDSSVSGGQVFAQDSDDSKLIATILQDKFNNLSNKNKKIKVGDYYLLNNTSNIGVIVECGFITNDEDRNNLTSRKYQQIISENITKGIYEYFNKKMLTNT
jgi:N-acetylmuramoyl-L-alanine amidase